jgi:hypothetical protein
MQRVYIVKTRKKIFININMTIIARHVDGDVRRCRSSDGTMGTVQPTGKNSRFQRMSDAPNDVSNEGWRGGGGGERVADKLFVRDLVCS